MDRKTAIAKLVRIYMEAQSLSEQEKEIKGEIKEMGMNPAIAAAVAKSLANGKATELKEKSQETLDLIDEVL